LFSEANLDCCAFSSSFQSMALYCVFLLVLSLSVVHSRIASS
jgi:hypothetical protein